MEDYNWEDLYATELNCSVSNFFNESFGKFPEDDAEYMLIMEFNKFLAHLADSRLPPVLDSNDDFKNWLRENPDTLY